MSVIDFNKYKFLNYSDVDEIINYAKHNNLEFGICFKSEDVSNILTDSGNDYNITIATMNTNITDRLNGICYVDLNEEWNNLLP